jgi:hypothetical protein
MEPLQKRIEALEQQTEELRHHTRELEAHTRTVERRLRWWRRMAYGLGVLGVLALPLASVKAQVGQSLEQRVEQLEYKLAHVTSGPDDITISGANLNIVNGLGATDTVNGLGNLIVGYNEHRPSPPFTNTRAGSHNVIVGTQHNFSSFGGLVIGQFNEISGPWASVSAGYMNRASGRNASVSGGDFNVASGEFSSASGGGGNGSIGVETSVSGGYSNEASGAGASVSGGFQNVASGDTAASVSGGQFNRATGGLASSVSGGFNRTAPLDRSWAAGALFQPN